MKIETYLPLFPGFYNSNLDEYIDSLQESELEHINSQREEKGLDPIEWGDCTWNNKELMVKISKSFCNAIESKLDELIPTASILFQEIISPKFYNYSTDSVNIEIDIDIDKVKGLLEDNKEEFATYLKENYSSHEGFTSFHPNTYEDWMEEFDEKISHNLGSALTFLLIHEYTEEEVMFDVMDKIHSDSCMAECENYEELTA